MTDVSVDTLCNAIYTMTLTSSHMKFCSKLTHFDGTETQMWLCLCMTSAVINPPLIKMPPKKTALKKKVGPRKGDSDSTAGGSEASETSCQGARNSSATCGVCDQTIVDGKEQALFCDGVCKQWFHRYCAGVPLSWFKTLSTSSTPFQCYSCCQVEHVKSVENLAAKISELQLEVGQLKNVVGDLKSSSTQRLATSRDTHPNMGVSVRGTQVAETESVPGMRGHAWGLGRRGRGRRSGI